MFTEKEKELVMNRKEIFNHYSTIIDNLIDNSVFFSAYFQAPWHLSVDITDNNCCDLPMNINVCSGAHRVCLIDKSYDWVIKIDIEEDYVYGSACQREINIFRDAKTQGLSKYFAPVMFLGTYNRTIYFYDINDLDYDSYDYTTVNEFEQQLTRREEDLTIKTITISLPLYAYRRASSYDCGAPSLEEQKRAFSILSPLRSRNIAVATAFIREYGMDAYKKLSDFSFEEDINDLHLGNIGSIDGTLHFIDYSGYHSEEDYNSDEENDETTQVSQCRPHFM